MLVSDLDGTLIFPDNLVSEEDLKAIIDLKSKGIPFVVATGRTLTGCSVIRDHHGLDYDYAVLANGAIIVDAKDMIIKKQTLNGSLVDKVVDYVKTRGFFICGSNGDTSYVLDLDYECPQEPFITLVSEEEYKRQELVTINITLLEKDIDVTKQVMKELIEIFGKEASIFRNQDFIDIVPLGCSKGEGVKDVAKLLKIPHTNVHVVGDSWNDESMFSNFENSYVLSHAEELLKTKAKRIVNNVSEISHYFLADK
ncbi:Cof-type HAD-IIB family hydrolase [Peribacillus muralis]|uniref:Cof-type HAD-IIB family hydrolase n=1 Tax=Peribacillus muralis TaxID=264697 RepID=UPI000709E3B5|nr:Cof-type HAD-IIB family hydrolase [Peribacillus muralis]